MLDVDLMQVTGFVLSLLRALTVVLLAWFTLRYFDKRLGFDFKNWWKDGSDEQKSRYLSARCFAVFLAFAICMA